ncbi:hypothetical protein EWG81_17540 [Salmonella enterica subsp. enterica serovar Muenchen]|uniref:Uncharacterized protein n=3 Tax=Salmonella enterica TaxID=28901 RepID=A0A3U7XMW8_SALMU|nr:hypothetical protein [Salmonella enterica subsp. enterica serovar Muenchen]EAM6634906.1 hypothetical protein [Salmonella enterica]EBS1998073.1 hypothetical protein [Salmonella enterica subsp. enterica serovar Infantis]ECA4662771.1 hypothetical protein [Salmonella enterica subsp. enterica serovar Newport]ECC2919541.1 hypothetical protein [Salmonella enterica subsp. enterica]ECU8583456.1 hypothetical protein [Salmonella enterica subsp. enterica serovar Typhimurium]EDC7374026.1 hypothetical p
MIFSLTDLRELESESLQSLSRGNFEIICVPFVTELSRKQGEAETLKTTRGNIKDEITLNL